MNGYGNHHSPDSGQISGADLETTLISRTQKQHTTQQITTTTKTVREISYLGPDGTPLPYSQINGGGGGVLHPTYEPVSTYSNPSSHYAPAPASSSSSHRPPTPPSPSDKSNSPPPQYREPDYLRSQMSSSLFSPPRSGYDELDTTLMPPSNLLLNHNNNNSPNNNKNNNNNSAVPPLSSSNSQQLNGRASSVRGGHQHFEEGSVHSYNNDESIYGEDEGGLAGYSGSNNMNDGNIMNHIQQHGYPEGSIYEERPPRAFFDEELDEPISSQSLSVSQPPIYNQASPGGRGVQEHLLTSLSTGGGSNTDPRVTGVHWRDPDLHEVIEFLSNPNSVIKANAAAYLQHLCYMDDPVKAKTRQLGGIPPLVALLANDVPEIYRNSCGALRNLSYGRQNDENKRAIKNANGIVNLVRLLRKTPDNEVKELVTGVLWNLSSCDDLKRNIIDEALSVLINVVIIPHSGWSPVMQHAETSWTTVFRNSSGILRNVSSAGDYGRKKLRESEGLVDSLLYLVRNAIEKANIDNKSVENCVCVLRNLSYRAQEIEDPNYDKKQFGNSSSGVHSESRAKPNSSSSSGGSGTDNNNLGCFGASKAKRKELSGSSYSSSSSSSSRGRSSGSGGPVKGMDLLWQPEVVQPYLNLLSNCSNPETLEAAAGAIQNLSACYWQPSIDVRAAVRKEKGLPILVELLRMEVDRVVCAVATALRNLAIDQRNKELIGKYAMRDLVQKLPGGNPQHDHGTSDDTIAAVLATLNEVIKKHPEFSRSLLEAGGVDRLMNITRQRQRYTPRVVKFASQVLYSMWVHQELRDVYRKAGWKEQDFVTKTVAARNARPNSPSNLNSTLNRPMASQSGTRYEDRTIQRGGARSLPGHPIPTGSAGNVVAYNPEEVPMENLSLYGSQRSHQMYAGGNHLPENSY
eukprot:TRINITY_DN410_c0_g1_i7.p1 TRINITY_DN410_c0_g1~~TRINITY_DN410_c0_g1_i7.p1  ORF type:complete len:914 (-),score=265.78 TRINITY_DN410_c0_g1_i7:1131-3872(-)